MLISEMHIALDQELDSINVNLEDNLRPEQKDFFLNREIQHFVKTRVREIPLTGNAGMDDITKRLIDIETLVEDDVVLLTANNAEEVWGNVPENYYYPVAARCFTSCSDKPVLKNKAYGRVDFEFFRDPDLWESFEIELILGGSSSIIFSMSDYPPYSTGVQDAQQDYVVHNLIVSAINNSNLSVKVYWEHYDGKYYPNTFIFIDSLNSYTAMSFKYKTASNNLTKGFSSVAYDTYETDSTFGNAEIRLYSLQEMRHFLNSTFNTTLSQSVLASLNGRLFKAYTLGKFIVANVLLTYIRKPQIVDLSLSSNCDLPYGVHDEIVKLTAKSIKAIISSQSYNTTVQETSLIN